MGSHDGAGEMNGYDIDGVLTAGIKPEEPYVVITGRVPSMWPSIVLDVGTAAPIYVNPYGHNHQDAGKWKAEVIKALGITKFYEDVPEQAAIIMAMNPDCQVIMVILTPNEMRALSTK